MLGLEDLVGDKAMLISAAPTKRCCEVELIAQFSNNTILVSQPKDFESYTELAPGKSILLRVNKANVSHNYQAKVKRICQEPYICLQLMEPGKDQKSTSDRELRLNVATRQINIRLYDGLKQHTVSVGDISSNGARLVSGIRLGRVNEIFNIELSTPHSNGKVCLPCKIRYVRTDLGSEETGSDSRYHHGVEFLYLQENAESFLSSFVV